MALQVKDGNGVTQNISTVLDPLGNQVSTGCAEGQKASYRASILALATPASATDVFAILGSASKTVRVTRVLISGTLATTASYIDLALVKRASANTGGTSTAPVAVPLDSADAAATAAVAAFTVNPTSLGTAVGPVAATRYFAPVTGTPALTTAVEFKFGDNNARGLVLRGVAQTLALSFNTGPALAGTFDITVEWTEE